MCQIWGVRIWQHNPMVGLNILVALVLMVACQARTSTQNENVLDAVKKRGDLHSGIRFDDPPHGYIDGQGLWVGFDVDIAEALAEEMGVILERVNVDELTRISYLKNGKIEVAVASMSHTAKRDEDIDFSQSYF